MSKIENKIMKLFVVGAGATGSVLVNTLAREKSVEHITVVSRSATAKEFVRPHKKVKLVNCDINNARRSIQVARGSDIVVNAASPWLNVSALKLALKIGAHYQDLGADMGFDDGKSKMPYKIEHRAFDKDFKRNKRIALFDTGAAPGLSNLLVASCSDELGNLEKATISLLEDIDAKVFISTWSPSAAVDEVYSRPVAYRRGRFVIMPRFSDPELTPFPKPFGKRISYSVMNNEAFTIPRFVNVKEIETRSTGSDDEAARMMIGLGLLEKKPVHIRGVSLSPLEFMMKIMPPPPTPEELKNLMKKNLVKNGFFGILVSARSRSKKCTYWIPFPSQKELFRKGIYSTYVAYPAGLCAAAFTLEMPRIKVRGVLPPEGLPKENRDSILRAIKNFGIKIIKNPSGLYSSHGY